MNQKKKPHPPPERVGRPDDANAFLRDPGDGPARSKDDLAEELAEEFLGSATSGEEQGEEAREQPVAEEIGGPFVLSTGAEEFAEGTDASNPSDATREPVPTTGRSSR